MAKPNYSFEKRQKEIARKKKKEEKKLQKADEPAASNSVREEASLGTAAPAIDQG